MTDTADRRTLLVAATGGHLTELFELQARLPSLQQAPLWFVPDSAQSQTLLRGRDVVTAPDVEPRDVVAVPDAAVAMDRLLRVHGVDCVVSTGSGVAIPCFAVSRARGIACHYIESAARVSGPSLTGRLLRGLPGVHLWSQNNWRAPGRWRRAPSVFDGFAPEVRLRPSGATFRVVVTLGTMKKYGFRRLVERIVPALPVGCDVLWQTGATDVSGLGIEATPWVSPAQLGDALQRADVVIAHAGVGSALAALDAGLRPVLVARRAAYGEHVDDHQVQLARALGEQQLATAIEPEHITPEIVLRAALQGTGRVSGERDGMALERSRRW